MSRIGARRAALAALAAGTLGSVLLACAKPEGSADRLAATAPVRVVATVEGDDLTVGDRFFFRLEVDAPTDTEVVIPEQIPEVDGVLALERLPDSKVTTRGRHRIVAQWRMKAQRVGPFTMPPVTVTHTLRDGAAGATTSGEVTGEVRSVLPPGERPADIRDLKPLERPARWWIAPLVLGLLALVAFAVWLVYRRRKRVAEGALAETTPFDVLALRELDRLRPIGELDSEAARRRAFELSEVLRRYVEARFAFNATDRTTEEILAGMGSFLLPGDEECCRLEEFVAVSDPIKYAGRPGARLQLERAYQAARAFVVATRPIAQDGTREQSSQGHAA